MALVTPLYSSLIFDFFFQVENNASDWAKRFLPEAMVKRLSKHHYLATPGEPSLNSHASLGHSLINTDYHHHRITNHRGYSTDGKSIICLRSCLNQN